MTPTRIAALERLEEAARAYRNSRNSIGRFDQQLLHKLDNALAALDAVPDSDDEWMPIETAPKDGTLLFLFVDYSEGDHPLEDEVCARTIGFNNYDNTGEDDGWRFSGWCWCHDHFVEGKGSPKYWRPLPPPPRVKTEGE